MKTVSPSSAPAAAGPYSQAIVSNGYVYTSGQIPVSPVSGKIEGECIEVQAEQAIKNVIAVLEAAGSSAEKVIKTTCFLKDMRDFAAFNEIYARYFTSSPARSCVEVSALPKGALVEIEAIAEPD
ncbi:MAG: RidA family protein [Clostridia bacterium]|nr:RidA family protein [Clostridia bacterium]